MKVGQVSRVLVLESLEKKTLKLKSSFPFVALFE